MKYALLALFCLCFQSIAFGAVASSSDRENNCTLYQSIAADANGNVVLADDQTLVSSKNVYGLSFIDMEVDFDRHEVRVQTMMNVVLGLNKPLVAGKSSIKEGNPDFAFLINQLNRKVSLFEKICISSSNEVVYAKMFETTEE